MIMVYINGLVWKHYRVRVACGQTREPLAPFRRSGTAGDVAPATCSAGRDAGRNVGAKRGAGRRHDRFDMETEIVFDDTEYSSDLDMWFARIHSFPPSSRSVALLHLLRVDQEGAFANHVSGDVLDQTPLEASIGFKRSIDALDPRDRRQVTEIVSGVIRWQRRLHWILLNLPKPTKIDSMDSPLRILLYMGAYELLELNLASHAINEYVNLAKYVMHEGCGKVTNGVLRSIVRAKDAGEVPSPPKPRGKMSKEDAANLLGASHSHPTWMVYRWLKQYGPKDTVALLNHNNMRPKFSLRLGNVSAGLEEMEALGVVAAPSAYLQDEFVVVESGLQSIIASGMLKRGDAQVQDEAAGMVVAMLHPEPGDTLLDCCAAPGGKTIFSAARMKGDGSITAIDAVESRTGAVKNAAAKQQYGSMITCITSDARQFCDNAALTGDTFDKVLVDAPCSGTGVLAKRADLRWRRKESDLRTLTSLQAECLNSAAKVVKPGGILVYSTCSIEREENMDIVERFLAEHPDFELVSGSTLGCIPERCLNESGCLQMLPFRHRTDGAFAARFVRTIPASSRG
jgi:16S rRNA (cytosine967-C5)-methyltransferase